jgi:hypothetical protein
MKKKLLFKLFIFAVIGAFVTVTSCKDYDDDISRLEEQSATKTALDAAIAELNTIKSQIAELPTDGDIATAVAAAKQEAINAAVAAANDAVNSATGDLEDELESLAGLITVLQGDVTALGVDLDAALVEIAANKAAIALQQAILDKYLTPGTPDSIVDAIAAIQAELAAANVDIEALSDRIDAIDTALNVLDFAKINSMITDITFDFAYDDYERYRFLKYSTTTEVVDYVFATGIQNPITFVEGQRLASQAQKILVKVSPSNADLSKMLDKISLIRGDANTEINDFLTPVKAERATPLITRAAPTATGLWYVTFELSQTADLEDLAELTYGDGVYLNDGIEYDTEGNYLFAMAIENTVDAGEDAEDRFIISDFVISVDTDEDFDRTSVLDFTVNDTPVAEINNRAADGSKSLNEDGITYEELVWSGTAQPTLTGNTTVGDDRSALAVYPAVQGEPMKIKLTTGDESIRAMYVTLDYKVNAIESAPSEWNAWTSYNYSGLGTVVEGTETEIVINNTSAINDIIGFRVFAVNLDGTLVDPDGKAFYVSLGVEGEDWGTVNTVITPESVDITGVESAEVTKILSELTGATTLTWTTDEDENEIAPAFNAYFVDADGTALFNTTSTDATGIRFEDVAKIYTVPTATSWLAYEDDKVYNGTLTVKNTTGHVIATLKVTF